MSSSLSLLIRDCLLSDTTHRIAGSLDAGTYVTVNCRSIACGSGTDKYINGSYVTETCLHSAQTT